MKAKRLLNISAALLLIPGISHATRFSNYQCRTFSINEGLSSSNVTYLTSDDHNRVWVGTKNGFNIINNGFVTSHVTGEIAREHRILRLGQVNAIAADGDVALISCESGLLIYDDRDMSFSEVLLSGKPIHASALMADGDIAYIFDTWSNSLIEYDFRGQSVSAIKCLDQDSGYNFEKILKPTGDRLLLADDRHGVFEFSLLDKSLRNVIAGDGGIVSEATIADSNDNIWISRYQNGIAAYSLGNGYNVVKTFNTANSTISSDSAVDILELPNQIIAISTNGGGVNLIDCRTGEVMSISNSLMSYANRLFSTSPYDLLVGTPYNGLCVIRDNDLHMLRGSNLISGDAMADHAILSFFDDTDDNIWFGTAGGGLFRYDEKSESVMSYPVTTGTQISSICSLDSEHLLLFSQYQGLFLFSKSGNTRMQPFLLNDPDSNVDPRTRFARTDDLVLTNAVDGSILIFNIDGKCCRIKNGKQTFVQFQSQDSQDKVLKVMPHRFTNVIVCKRKVYGMENQDNLWAHALFVTEEDIISAAIDEDCNIWFITHSGLFRHALSTNETQKVDLGIEMPTCISLLYSNGEIWMAGGDKNLYRYSVADKKVSAFTMADGLSDNNDFWENAIATSYACYFTGSSGVVAAKVSNPPTPINSLGLSADCMGVTVDGTAVPHTKKGYLIPSDHIQIKIRLAIKSSSPTVPSSYRYSIIDKNGRAYIAGTKSDPDLIIGHIPAGQYTLKIAQFGENGWRQEEELIHLYQRSRFMTYDSIMTMLAILLAMLAGYLYFLLNRRKKEAAANTAASQPVFNTAQPSGMTVGTQVHSDFLTNIGQILNAPVSLIYNMAKRLQEDGGKYPEIKDSIDKIARQADRLKGSVRFVLESVESDDKISKGAIESTNVDELIRLNINEILPTCQEHGRDIDFVPDDGSEVIEIDRSKVEISLRALLVNASKNCNRNGKVTVSTSITNTGHLRISMVYHDGKSYPSDYDDLFSHNWVDTLNSGFDPSGLAISRTAIEMVGGKVSGYRNVENGGSTFYIDIPVNKASDLAFKDFVDLGIDDDKMQEKFLNSDFTTKDQTLLIVDDEEDVRDYLKEEFSDKFKAIYLAKDGKEGLEMVRSKVPSIIVSDVKMPRMTGFELCKTIKSELEISHLPVILLTSAAESKSQEIGYKMGADVFIPKPFDTKALFHAIEAQLRNRYELKKRYFTSPLPEITPEETISVADEDFVLKLNKFINSNISNPDLNVEMILAEMCISRTALFNKMSSLIGVSAAKYIKKIRIERAKDLIINSNKSIFDIAVEVGYTESQYFSTVFKQETGKTPSQFRISVSSTPPPRK